MTQSAETATTLREALNFVGGEWVAASGGATFDVTDPFTGETVVRAAAGTRDDARRAIEAAAEAFPAWAATPPAVRQGIFLRAADILESRRDEVVDLLARETGATFGFGMFQMHFTPGLLRQAAGSAYAPLGEVIPSDIPGAMAMGLRQPVGVVGAIAPWNAALILSLRSITAPLALGNTVVLKPSEWSPVSGGTLWGEVFAEAGLPAGVLNIVTHAPGEAAGIGDELVENPAVRRLNFTGSTHTGRRLAEACGRQLKRVVLELGGSNPLIVLADADLEYAVDAAAFGAFLHQGQICMSTRRIFVERSIADAFTEKLVAKTAGFKVGDPKEHDTIIGPLINGQALSTVAARVQDAVDRGAKLLVGGETDGPCYKPTLVTDVPGGLPVLRSRRRSARLPRSRSWTTPTRRSSGQTPPGTGSRPGSSPATTSEASSWQVGSSRASSMSTTRRSATSRRCRSAASRTRVGVASGVAPRSRSSPSCGG